MNAIINLHSNECIAFFVSFSTPIGRSIKWATGNKPLKWLRCSNQSINLGTLCGGWLISTPSTAEKIFGWVSYGKVGSALRKQPRWTWTRFDSAPTHNFKKGVEINKSKGVGKLFDLVVVPVIVRGFSLTPEEKQLLFKWVVFFIAGSGWLMFFQFVLKRIVFFIKSIRNKKRNDKND